MKGTKSHTLCSPKTLSTLNSYMLFLKAHVHCSYKFGNLLLKQLNNLQVSWCTFQSHFTLYRSFSVIRRTVFSRKICFFLLYVSAEIAMRLIAEYFGPTKYNNSNIPRMYT